MISLAIMPTSDSGQVSKLGDYESYELAVSIEQDLNHKGYYDTLTSPLARILLDRNEDERCRSRFPETYVGLEDAISHVYAQGFGSDGSDVRKDIYCIGIAALNAFLQSNVTGPPLKWSAAELMFSPEIFNDSEKLRERRRQAILDLTVDGVTVYLLTPNIELFWLAKSILNHDTIVEGQGPYTWGRLRVNFWHQRMLSEISTTLQGKIYRDLATIENGINSQSVDVRAKFLLEKAAIHTYHGFDVKAREDIIAAARERHFQFALTGRLGKRTKFQQDELSQLVVLAKSTDDNLLQSAIDKHDSNGTDREVPTNSSENPLQPLNLQLNDDTLLEDISFSKNFTNSSWIDDEKSLPQALLSLDPANQPTLHPLDSIILLATASSIVATSPQDDLTREETLPYATRVLSGTSTNWQIYTQALLVRSRIEGHRSRTAERGVLQLQALVDQVIAETDSSQPSCETSDGIESSNSSSNTFLPKPRPSESASASERLSYIHQLAPPTRWKLEAELADRWVSLGGLRTALEIYGRLEMWAEVALCWAASDREDKAVEIIKYQLYDESNDNIGTLGVEEDFYGILNFHSKMFALTQEPITRLFFQEYNPCLPLIFSFENR